MRKLFYLFAVCLLSSCSIISNIEDSIGLSISEWESHDLKSVPVDDVVYTIQSVGDFKIQKIDGEVYFTYLSGDISVFGNEESPYKDLYDGSTAMKLDIKTLKLTYDGTDIVPEMLFAKILDVNVIESFVVSINGKLATIIRYKESCENIGGSKDIVDVYFHSEEYHRLSTLWYTDLFSGYSVVEYINTWSDNGVAYISAVVDYTKIIVGRFDAYNTWSVISTYDTGGRVLDLDVKMGRSYPYAIWSTSANKMTLAAFDYANSSKSSWNTLATINGVKSSQLSVENYINAFTGILSEDVYVSVIGATYSEFQLYKLNSYKQLARIGDYILGIPNDYNFVNYKGLILLSHSSYSMKTPLTFNSITEKWGNNASISQTADVMQTMVFDNAVALMLIEDVDVTIEIGK